MTFVDEIRNAAAAAATNASAVTANATAIAENTTLDETRNTATLQMITLRQLPMTEVTGLKLCKNSGHSSG